MTQQITVQADGFLTSGSIYAFSNGDIAALFLRGGTGYYAVSQDGGTTWGPAQAVPQWTNIPPQRLAATQHGDTIALLTVQYGSTSMAYPPVPAVIPTLALLTYNPMLHQFNAPTQVSQGAFLNSYVTVGDIAWNSADSHYYLAFGVQGPSSNDLVLTRCTATGSTGVGDSLSTGWAWGTTLYGVRLLTTGTGAYLLAGDASHTTAAFFAANISGAMTVAAPEYIAAINGSDAGNTVMRLDGAGHVDLFCASPAHGSVVAVKRTAANTYTSTTLATGTVPQPPSIAASFDAVSGDAIVFYSLGSTLLARRRLSGTWQAASTVDTVPYAAANPLVHATRGVLAMARGTGPGQPLDYLGIGPLSGAPNAPTNMTPNGATNTVTPVLTATYTNAAPGDIQHSLQDVVTRDSDSVVMWDSGEIVTTAASQTYAGTALSFNTNYTWKRRYKDEITRAWGPYASVPLQPAHLPTATITSVAFAGTTASSTPFTLTDPTLGVTATFTQADGDSADQYQLVVLKADGVTVQESGRVVPLSPVVANSASFTTATHNFTSLVNSTTYTLGVMTRDAATGRVGLGPLWTFTTAWPPPSAPSGLTVAPNDQAGTIAVTWTNSGGALTTTLLEVSLDAGTTWVTHYSGPPVSSLTLRGIAPGQPFLVRVSLANSVGSSAPTVSSSYTLGLNAYINGIILTDTVTLQSVFLGPTESEESLGLKNITSFQEIERMGQKNFRYFFSRLETRAGSWDVTLRASERQQDGTYVYSADKERIMRALENNHNDVLLRTVLGEVHTVKVLNVDPKPFKGRVLRCTFDLKKVDDPPYPLTS